MIVNFTCIIRIVFPSRKMLPVNFRYWIYVCKQRNYSYCALLEGSFLPICIEGVLILEDRALFFIVSQGHCLLKTHRLFLTVLSKHV